VGSWGRPDPQKARQSPHLRHGRQARIGLFSPMLGVNHRDLILPTALVDAVAIWSIDFRLAAVDDLPNKTNILAWANGMGGA